MKTPSIKVTTDPINPESVEIIAGSIIRIATAIKAVDSSRLSRKAIVALIHDNSGMAKSKIEIVLNNLAALEAIYLKPLPQK